MRKMYCPECDGEIMITRKVPEYSWTIEENDLKRSDNLHILDGPELIFHCQNDREHDIYKQLIPQATTFEFNRWIDEVEDFFDDNVLPYL